MRGVGSPPLADQHGPVRIICTGVKRGLHTTHYAFRRSVVTAAVLLLFAAQRGIAQEDSLCLDCHDDPDNDMVFDATALPRSVHADQACIDCHDDLAGMTEDHGKVKRVDCSGCHEDEVAAYRDSEHGKAIGDGVKEAASCVDCHGKPHAMLSSGSTNAPTHYTHVVRMCGECHTRPEVMALYRTHRKETVFAFTNSVHGLSVTNKNGKHAAVCTDCHGVHAIKRGTDPKSDMFWQNIPQTCGKCHEEIGKSFARSVHGAAVIEGKRDAPVCTDCHGEHSITAVKAAASFVSPTHIPETCGQCHGVERIATRYRLPSNVVDSYMDSFHGLASQIGGVAAANCASCHGYHEILPSNNPESSINPAKLPETCGKCHKGIGTRMASGDFRVHEPPGAAPGKPAIVNIISNVYVFVICLVIGGMVFFTSLDFAAKVRAHVNEIRSGPDVHPRMSPLLRVQHGLLIITFVLLAYTGFVHKFPDTFWSWPFRVMEDGSYWRGFIHRVAGWLFTALFGGHLLALIGTSRGRMYLRHLSMKLHDGADALRVLRRNLGLGGALPEHRQFNFAEKAEYWALLWGSIVMIITGVMLIFSSAVLHYLPQVWLEVAQVVHYYEAVLATLAIVVWHFYWVIFDPNEYPMNPAWLVGLRAEPDESKGRDGSPSRPSSKLPIILLLLIPTLATAQENTLCLDCHDDAENDMLYDTNAFARSVHGDLNCIDCHDDLEGITEDHDKVKRVDCTGCHEDEAALEAESLHGAALARGDELAPRCQSCHGSHDILPVKNHASAVAATRIPAVCGQCHREGGKVQMERHIPPENVVSNYAESIHGEALFKKGLIVAPSCISCHTAHHILPPEDDRSTIARTNIAKTCSACHAMIEEVHRKVIDGELWETEQHKLPACADCHQPHRIRKVFYDQGMADHDCMSCHEKPDLVSTNDGRSLFIDYKEAHSSIHSNIACVKCHSQVQASHVRPCETITEKVNCGACHEDQMTHYLRGVHGQLFTKGDDNAPTCLECHGIHGILDRTHAKSPTFPLNVPELCGRCHREGEKAAARYKGTEHDIVNHYNESIHGKGLRKSGLTVTATCADCHTAHQELPAADPASSVNRANIAATCARCHHGIGDQFAASIHATAKTDKQLPVCGDCHSAHSIARTDRDAFRMETMDVCGKCHEELAEAYFDTFHGKVSKLGFSQTAKCQDCHGAHAIFPASDPRSTLSEENALGTCQECHPKATVKFAGYFTHANHHDRLKYPEMFYAFWFMTALLVGTFVVSGLHTLLWLPRTLAMRKTFKREHVHEAKGKVFQRFRRIDRISHATMIVCFLTLAVTGMTLKFAYTEWASMISHALGGFQTCGYLHRVAAAVMFGLYAVHMWDLAFVKRKIYGSWKELLFGPNTMLFTKRDGCEFVESIRWFLGRGPRPQYGRWTYWEKFDYMAVFWGIVVIGSTGVMLWFPEWFTRFLPGWAINVATIVHSDEALLAAGFIFTIHFFNTHLRPEKFPMDTVIFTGRMTVEELKLDKPEEYERLSKSGELEQYLVDPLPAPVVKRLRFFGWVALTIGVSVVIWILYAMISAYF